MTNEPTYHSPEDEGGPPQDTPFAPALIAAVAVARQAIWDLKTSSLWATVLALGAILAEQVVHLITWITAALEGVERLAIAMLIYMTGWLVEVVILLYKRFVKCKRVRWHIRFTEQVLVRVLWMLMAVVLVVFSNFVGASFGEFWARTTYAWTLFMILLPEVSRLWRLIETATDQPGAVFAARVLRHLMARRYSEALDVFSEGASPRDPAKGGAPDDGDTHAAPTKAESAPTPKSAAATPSGGPMPRPSVARLRRAPPGEVPSDDDQSPDDAD